MDIKKLTQIISYRIKLCLSCARFSQWAKNIFMIPGFVLALTLENEIEFKSINNDAVVTIFFGLSAFNKNNIGLKKIPPPIPTIPDINPKIIPIGIEIKRCIFLIIIFFSS